MRVGLFITLMMISSLAMSAPSGEFDNSCTTSLAAGLVVKSDCTFNSEYEGKTYCFGAEASKVAFDQAANKKAIVNKAKVFFDTLEEVPRSKISQADAMALIKSAQCDLSDKDLGYLNFDGLDLRHCKLSNTSFFGAYLRGANLSGTNLKHAYLNLARLENADLSHADLTDATIFQAIFDKTNFNGANLTNARMIGTLGNVAMNDANITRGRFGLDIGNQPMGAMRFDAVGGKFANSNFEGADINRANLQFADLKKANLKNTNLFRADLSKADLTNADITGANLKEAILDGAIMTGVKGLEAIQVYDISKGECINCNTGN